MENTTLFYAHDPMCSWCWAFRPTWRDIVANLPGGIRAQRLLGGLAPDNDMPMPAPLREMLRQTWQRIQAVVPGTQFNFAFWDQCTPRRSTYPACRAVVAARHQDPAREEDMILAIQNAYYLNARNPSDDDTLVDLAAELGLDPERFRTDLAAAETQAELMREVGFAQRIGAQGFPSLILEAGGRYRILRYDYNDPQVLLNQLH